MISLSWGAIKRRAKVHAWLQANEAEDEDQLRYSVCGTVGPQYTQPDCGPSTNRCKLCMRRAEEVAVARAQTSTYIAMSFPRQVFTTDIKRKIKGMRHKIVFGRVIREMLANVEIVGDMEHGWRARRVLRDQHGLGWEF